MSKSCIAAASFFAILWATELVQAADSNAPAKAPAVGEKAPEFALKDLDDKSVALGDVLKDGPAVVVMLRGYPGYQCPICAKQFGELLSQAAGFAEQKATVVFVYPGPASDLDKYAKEFIGGKSFPPHFRFVIDPDFKFTELYKLRWNARGETAYPATFVIDGKGMVRFTKVSQSHGGRASSGEMLDSLGQHDR
jgi:thioredoxin-dependent peroxiredoxin